VRIRCLIGRTLLLVVTLACGCSQKIARQEDREVSEPIIQKARSRAESGDIDSALRLYLAALDANPRLARAHLDMAILWHDYKKDYVRAIYDYQRYLEMRPATEKRQMIEGRIRAAGQMYAATVLRPNRFVEENLALRQENSELRNTIDSLRQEREDFKHKYEQASEQMEMGSGGVRPLDVSATNLPVSDMLVVSHAARTNETVKPRAYRVRPGDTLSSIAMDFYQDGYQWNKIYEANRQLLAESKTLKVGQLLVIP